MSSTRCVVAIVVGIAGMLGLGAGCRDVPAEGDVAAVGCERPSLEAPGRFVRCDLGSGVFGRWTLDEHGLPAYAYTLARGDERAVWTLSDGSERSDHLFQIGNDRLIGVVDTDGFTQVFLKDRGPQFLNRVDTYLDHFGGGFSWVREGAAVWATAAGLAAEGVRVTRTFGVQTTTQQAERGGVVVTHRLVMPPGDARYVIDEVTLENRAPFARTLTHYEAWDVNRHWLSLQLLRSGAVTPNLPLDSDRARAEANAAFIVDVVERADEARVRQRKTAPRTAPTEATALDEHPLDTFLVRLHDRGGRFHTDRRAFIGDGDLQVPEAVRTATAPATFVPQSGIDQPALLVDETTIVLAPGERVVLRYAYGAVEQDAPAGVEAFGDDVVAASVAAHAAALPRFVVPDRPQLQREMAWHGAQLLGATAYDGVFGVHHTVQGSAYQYLHGLDGAARDYALFALPLIYLRPDLARENLRMIMRATYADTGQISYATAGLGLTEDAVIHTNPSDLDIFFLWALSEYLVATGDHDFLDEENAFYPPSIGRVGSVREHARVAVDHLMRDDGVGRGPHGLVRVRTGDWSDGIALKGSDRDVVLRDGESVPNTQMATWVLPLAAAAIFDDGDADDRALAAVMRGYAAELREALPAQFLPGGWYRRAWFGEGEPYGDDVVDLEAQVWALIGETGDAQQMRQVADTVFVNLDEQSAVGAPLWRGGDVWHAITGLLSWGYMRIDPARAWRSFNNHTMAAYAEAHPTQWFGIWSGPDGIGQNGGTWGSPATPMMDWPTMNANQHAMPLLAMLRVAGIEPTTNGELRVGPWAIPGAWVLDTPLLFVRVDGDGALRGELRGVARGAVRLALPVSAGQSATIDGEVVAADADGFARRTVVLTPGARVAFTRAVDG